MKYILFGFSPPTKHALHMFFRLLGTGPVHLPKHKCFSDSHHLPKHNKCFSVSRVHLPKHKSVSRLLGRSRSTEILKAFPSTSINYSYFNQGKTCYQSTIFLPVQQC